MMMCRHQNAGQNHNIKRANRSFENVAKFNYLVKVVTNQNLIHEKIKSKLNSGDACYHSVQYDLSSRLLYKNVKFTKKTKLNSVAFSPQAKYRPSDRRLSATLVPTFADRGCRVVSATDPYGR
jgi:hypothetical protein